MLIKTQRLLFIKLFCVVQFVVLVNSINAQVEAQQPQLDTISIDTENHPTISWIPNTDVGITSGYVIVRKINSISERIDTVPGIDTSFYRDLSIQACANSIIYNIYAEGFGVNQDSDWTDSLFTINLNQPKYDTCSNSIQLEWTKYRNMPGGLGGYWVLASVDGGDYEIVGTTPASQNFYLHEDLLPDVQYTYKIRAFSQDKTRTSTSCEKSENTVTYDKPEEARILVVTVDNFEHVKLSWQADDAEVSRFKVFRNDGDGVFNFIGENVDTIDYSPEITFIDNSANFNLQSYEYRIEVYDFCDKAEIITENDSRTVHLSAQKSAGPMIDLQWNAYEGWDNISGYEVYREVDGAPDPAGPLATLSAGETSHSDDVSNLTGSKGNLAYYVKALENGTGPTESFSNKVVVELETNILIPNALLPESGIDFKPVLDFIEEGFYEMTIFNKWGQQIFVSDNKDEGWNGRYNGEIVPAGTYVYVINFRNARGELVEKQGTVTVVR